MGLFDTIRCDYPLPDPRLQDVEFQTKSLDCAMQRYTITADGRLLRHPGGGLFDEPPRSPTLEKDVELPIRRVHRAFHAWASGVDSTLDAARCPAGDARVPD